MGPLELGTCCDMSTWSSIPLSRRTLHSLGPVQGKQWGLPHWFGLPSCVKPVSSSLSPLLPACPSPDPVLLEQGNIGDEKTEEAKPAKVELKVGRVFLVRGLIGPVPQEVDLSS